MLKVTHSRYNILAPLKHGRILAYNSMTGASAIWEETESQLFEQIGDGEEFDATNEAVLQLLYGGFVVLENIDELSILRQQYIMNRYDPTGMTVSIAPTQACNFGCDYCFQGQNKPSGKMSQDVQDAIAALVERAAPKIKRLHIGWYGGEPLLAQDIIESLSDCLISLCSQHSIAYDAMIVTNGYKLTSEVAKSLYERRVRVAQVTLDGPPDLHDQRRVLLGGKGTFERIVENLREVVEEVPIRTVIRVNIESRNSGRIPELLDYLREKGFANRKNFGVYFAPVEAITQSCHAVADVCLSKSQYGQLEAELTRHAYNAGLTTLPYPGRFRGLCAAVKPKGFVVAPNGDLHKCWDTIQTPDRKVGTVFDIDALNTDQLMLEWIRWTPFDNATCTNCKILPNCAGACAHKFVNADQTLGEAGSIPCPSWKYNIKELLVFRAVHSGAITSDDYNPEEIHTDASELQYLS